MLDPEYGGRGIMSEMVGCVVEGWVRGWMGLGTVGAVSLSCYSLGIVFHPHRDQFKL